MVKWPCRGGGGVRGEGHVGGAGREGGGGVKWPGRGGFKWPGKKCAIVHWCNVSSGSVSYSIAQAQNRDLRAFNMLSFGRNGDVVNI